MLRSSLMMLTLLTATPAASQAHYLYIEVVGEGEHGRMNLYFEEGPQPGMGEYLDPFIERGVTWIRTIDGMEPAEIELEEVVTDAGRWLRGDLPDAPPRSIESYVKWGVSRYGQTDVLLHFYAKFISAATHDELHALSHTDHLDLDIVPSISEGRVSATVLWQGEPAAGRSVEIRSRRLRLLLTTDDEGRIEFDTVTPGDYIFRTSHDEPDAAGEFEGKTYEQARHHATLSIWLPLPGGCLP